MLRDVDRATTSLADSIARDVATLCAFAPDRHVGSAGNHAATAWLADRFAAAGLEVERLPFGCVDWRRGEARLRAGDDEWELQPGPYSPAANLTDARLLTASSIEELERLESAADAILLLHGPLVSDQLTPRNYPFYRFDAHTRILDALDRLQPGAVVAATGSNPGSVGALCPFPYVEDADFGYPSAYVHESVGGELLALAGMAVSLEIDSEQVPASGEQVVATLPGGKSRVVVSAHVDARFGTPGALDNAASVACVLATAEALAARRADWNGPTIEFVPFNGEDNFAAYGEMAYLDARKESFTDISMAVNLDAAGYRGATSHVSYYGVGDEAKERVDRVLGGYATIDEGPQWPQSDHMIFAMRGTPALAITTSVLGQVTAEYTHTEHDVPALVDPVLLADIARFLEELLAGM